MTAHSVPWRDVIADAVAAPSAHNTQPWRFVVRGDVGELHLDQERVLPVADPDGREARLSCGAALLNLRLALQVRGLRGEPRLLPDRAQPLLLAAVRADRARPATPLEHGLHGMIHRRHSHRQPFHLQPVPAEVRHGISAAATVEGATLTLVDAPPVTGRIAQLVREAERLQQDDPRFLAELACWTFDGHTRHDGVPGTAGGPRPVTGTVMLRDFTPGRDRPQRAFESDPLFAVLLSVGDTALDQLRAGQALQRALLTATMHGAAANILSQPVEVPAARATLRALFGGGHPQLVLRIGMASTTATAPRRPASEVLRIEDAATLR